MLLVPDSEGRSLALDLTRRRTIVSVFIFVTMWAIQGCARPANRGHYVYTFRYSDEKWVDYDVSSRSGVREVESWIAAHRHELERGAALIQGLGVQRLVALKFYAADGTIVDYVLLDKYPIGPGPLAERTYVENLSRQAASQLHDICVENGIRSERTVLRKPAPDVYCGEDTDEEAESDDRP